MSHFSLPQFVDLNLKPLGNGVNYKLSLLMVTRSSLLHEETQVLHPDLTAT